MKTLILYATKNGATREIAERISKKMNGAVLHNLNQENIPDLSGYDRIIIGSSIYAGMIRKEAKTFLTGNIEKLKTKTLGLYVSGLEADQEKTYFETNFPAELIKSAKTAMFLGGIFDPKKAGVMGRMVMKVIAKKAEYLDNIDNDKINKFVEALKS